MLLAVKKWSNSAAIWLPAKVLNAAQVGIEQRVNVHLQGRRIVIDPAVDEDNLDTLLTQVTPENVHDEVSSGPPAGEESFYCRHLMSPIRVFVNYPGKIHYHHAF